MMKNTRNCLLIRSENKCIMFINAWNKWSESIYLEPDKKYGFGY
ncbi:MAG: glycoside hydrolase family 99-like domain-containing protein [Lentisphaeria bacterium]